MKKRLLEDKITREFFLKEAPEDEETAEETEEPTAAEDTDTGADDTDAGDEEEIDWGEDEESEETEDDSDLTIDNTSALDAEIDSVLVDFESRSLVSTPSEDLGEPANDSEGADEELQEEGYVYKSGISFLLKESDDITGKIDINIFAMEVARLIKNYDNLLDMESLLLQKAEKFIQDKYGDEVAEKLLDTLDVTHGISLDSDLDKKSDIDTPLAVGASSEAAAAT